MYICKSCKSTETDTSDVDEIVSRKKLCLECLSIHNKDSLVKTTPKRYPKNVRKSILGINHSSRWEERG